MLGKRVGFFFCFGLAKNDRIVVQSSTAVEKRKKSYGGLRPVI